MQKSIKFQYQQLVIYCIIVIFFSFYYSFEVYFLNSVSV